MLELDLVLDALICSPDQSPYLTRLSPSRSCPHPEYLLLIFGDAGGVLYSSGTVSVGLEIRPAEIDYGGSTTLVAFSHISVILASLAN